MRVVPVFIINSAGEWLFDSVCSEWMNAIRSTCCARFGNNELTHEPLRPCCAQSNGDFISGPTAPGKKPVFGSKSGSGWPSRFCNSGL